MITQKSVIRPLYLYDHDLSCGPVSSPTCRFYRHPRIKRIHPVWPEDGKIRLQESHQSICTNRNSLLVMVQKGASPIASISICALPSHGCRLYQSEAKDVVELSPGVRTICTVLYCTGSDHHDSFAGDGRVVRNGKPLLQAGCAASINRLADGCIKSFIGQAWPSLDVTGTWSSHGLLQHNSPSMTIVKILLRAVSRFQWHSACFWRCCVVLTGARQK